MRLLLAMMVAASSLVVSAPSEASSSGLSYYRPDPNPGPPHRPPPPYRPDPNPPPPYRPDPNPPPPYRPDPRPWPDLGWEEPVTVHLNQWYTNARLPLREMLRLDRWYWGYQVNRVEVVTCGASKRWSELKLFINGFMEDRVIPDGRYNTLYVRGFKEIGREINTLQLQVDGRICIESVTAYVSR